MSLEFTDLRPSGRQFVRSLDGGLLLASRIDGGRWRLHDPRAAADSGTVVDHVDHGVCDCPAFERDWDCRHVEAAALASLVRYAEFYRPGRDRPEVRPS